MERERDERDENRSGVDSLAEGTGMQPDEESPMRPGKDVSDANEASGDEKTAVEGTSGLAATNRAWGGAPTNAEGGIGTHVPTADDEHMQDRPDERRDSSDPRGY